MTPAERLVDRLKTVAAVAVVLGTLAIWLYLFQETKREDAILASAPRYTIGGVTHSSYVVGPSSGKVVFFVYRVRDSVYTGSVSGTPVNGQERLLIKFSARQPGVYKAYDYVPVPAGNLEPPPGGWLEPPFPVPAEMLE